MVLLYHIWHVIHTLKNGRARLFIFGFSSSLFWFYVCYCGMLSCRVPSPLGYGLVFGCVLRTVIFCHRTKLNLTWMNRERLNRSVHCQNGKCLMRIFSLSIWVSSMLQSLSHGLNTTQIRAQDIFQKNKYKKSSVFVWYFGLLLDASVWIGFVALNCITRRMENGCCLLIYLFIFLCASIIVLSISLRDNTQRLLSDSGCNY